MLIGLAAIWCASRGIEKIALGTLAGNPFADATEEFFEGLRHSFCPPPLASASPLPPRSDTSGRRSSCRRYAHLPLGLTLTCMAPRGGVHCDACNKCRERKEAFAEASVADGAAYDAAPGREVA